MVLRVAIVGFMLAIIATLALVGILSGREEEGAGPGTELAGEISSPTAPTPADSPGVTLIPAPAPIALESSAFVGQEDGITILGPEGWSTLDVPDLLARFVLRDLAVDDQGRLWVLGTGVGGVRVGVFDGSQWTLYDVDGTADVLAVDSRGQVWVDSLLGVEVFMENDWVEYSFPPNWVKRVGGVPVLFGIYDIAVDDRGRLWAATGNGLMVLDGDEWTRHDLGVGPSESQQERELEAPRIYTVAIGPDGRVWAGHWQGVSVFDGQRWVTYDSPPGVEDIAFDNEGGVWAVGGTSEVWAFRDGEWTMYDRMNSGFLGGEATPISVDPRGRVWIGTDWHLTVFDGTRWVNYTAGNSGLQPKGIAEIVIPAEGPAVLPEPTRTVGTVTGRVTFNGEPLPGAEVHVCQSVWTTAHFLGYEIGCSGEEYIAATGPDGRFSVENIPMGRYGFATVTPDGEWYLYGERPLSAIGSPPSVHFNLDAGETHDLGKIALGEE